jgi:hypothetical protein
MIGGKKAGVGTLDRFITRPFHAEEADEKSLAKQAISPFAPRHGIHTSLPGSSGLDLVQDGAIRELHAPPRGLFVCDVPSLTTIRDHIESFSLGAVCSDGANPRQLALRT